MARPRCAANVPQVRRRFGQRCIRVPFSIAGGPFVKRSSAPRSERTLLTDLKELGVDPGEIDVVINTHLHSDHCGWNTIRMGDKIAAKQAVTTLGIPTVPGSEGAVASESEAAAVAKDLGYPVLIKATAGGGGRGMKVARSPSEFRHSV